MEDLKKSFLVRGNNIVGFGGSGEENTIESISVNGVDIAPDENKNVDITVPSIDGLTKDADLATVAKSGNYEDLDNKPEIPSIEGLAKTTDIPTKVSQLENDSKYLSSIPEEYITETELNAKGYLTEHQDLSAYATKDEIPTVPSKVSELTNDSNYQTAEQVNSTVTTEIAKVVADAPEDLNTLKEMSDWIAGHEDDASAMNSAISDNKTAITTLQTDKADKSEIPTALPANGGNSLTVNGHTVKSDVPENAVFTDTIYDDTEVKESITELNSNLVSLAYGENGGGSNIIGENVRFTKVTSWDDSFPPNNTIDTSAYFENGAIKTRYEVDDWVIIPFHFKNGVKINYATFKDNAIIEEISICICNLTNKLADITSAKTYTPTSTFDGYICIGKHIKQADSYYPMLSYSAITPYEPYIPSVKMLSEEVSAQNESLAYNASKNMLTVNVGTISGVTITLKDKSTALLNGTSTANVSVFTTADVISSGSYHLKLSNKVGSMFVWDTIHSKTIIDVDNTECNFTLTEPSKLLVGFSVGNGHSFTNFETSGQLEKGTVATDFVPYNGKSNLELTNDIVSLKNDLDMLEFGEAVGGKNILDINKVLEWIKKYTNGTYSNDTLTISPINNYLFTNPFQFSDVDIDVTLSVESFNFSGGSNARISLLNSNNISVGDIYTGMTTISAKASRIRIDYSTLPTSITLSKLMLQLGTQATEYEPYIPSVRMLAEEVNQQNESLGALGKCKNLLKPTLQTTTQNGVTCTNNGDGTYTLNGTASGLTTFILRDMKLDSSLSYKLTGCPLGGDWDNGYSMYVEKQYWGIDTGKGYKITLTDASNICGVYIRIIKDTVCNNLVFKPMITTNLNATYDDFVPYTGDGDTLTHDVAEIKNDLGGFKLNSGWFRYEVTQTNTDITMTDDGKYDGTFPTINKSTPIFFSVQGSSTNTAHKTHVYTDGGIIKINTDVAQRYSIRWLTLS